MILKITTYRKAAGIVGDLCYKDLNSPCNRVSALNGPFAWLFPWIRGFLAEGTRPLKEVKHLVCFVMRSRNARSTLLIINKQDIVCHHHRMSFLQQRTDWGWRKSRTGLPRRAPLITASVCFPLAVISSTFSLRNRLMLYILQTHSSACGFGGGEKRQRNFNL